MADTYAFIRQADLDAGTDRVTTLRQGGKADLLADPTFDPDDEESWPKSGVGASLQTVSVTNRFSGEAEDALLCPLS
jgi:hypothetical protein